mmetsp:Transcript_46654/g.74607  ORF Transcript_46654/g.74607 Transcript_46654/m.74607 type:complete len:200 (+) Transcript_46654:67-666(+)
MNIMPLINTKHYSRSVAYQSSDDPTTSNNCHNQLQHHKHRKQLHDQQHQRNNHRPLTQKRSGRMRYVNILYVRDARDRERYRHSIPDGAAGGARVEKNIALLSPYNVLHTSHLPADPSTASTHSLLQQVNTAVRFEETRGRFLQRTFAPGEALEMTSHRGSGGLLGRWGFYTPTHVFHDLVTCRLANDTSAHVRFDGVS